MIRLVILLILSIFIISVYCIDSENNDNNEDNSTQMESKLTAVVESRRRKVGHYFYHPYHGWYALSWIYWIKVKLVVIAFFAWTAFIWGIQYLAKFTRQCPTDSHIHYGHYRALASDPIIDKFLHSLK